MHEVQNVFVEWVPRSTRSVQKVSTLSHFLNGSFTIAVYTPFTPFHTTLFTLLLWWSSIEDKVKGVKSVSHSSALLYPECKLSANKWQSSDHFWSTWVAIGIDTGPLVCSCMGPPLLKICEPTHVLVTSWFLLRWTVNLLNVIYFSRSYFFYKWRAII